MHRRVGFLLFTAGWGANHFASLLVVYRKELGLTAAELGVLFGAYALGLVPGLLLSGRASDARGRRALVLPASILAIAASAMLAFGGYGFRVLLAGRLIYGVAMGAVMSPGSVWVQELSPPGLGPRRATLALSAGFGLGPLASGVIAEFAPYPMVLPYLAHVIVMIVALVLAQAVPETANAKRDARPVVASAPSPNIADSRSRVLAGLLPVAPWSFGFAGISAAVMPQIMRPHVSRPVLYSAFVIVTMLGTGVLVQPLTTKIGRRADLVGLAVGAAGTLLSAYAVSVTSPLLVFPSAILTGVGYGLVITTGLREVSERVRPEERGTAVGIYYVLTYIGFAVPFVHATAAKTYGDVRVLEVTAAVMIACLALRAWIESRSRIARGAGISS